MLWNGDHWLHAMVGIIPTVIPTCFEFVHRFDDSIIPTAELA